MNFVKAQPIVSRVHCFEFTSKPLTPLTEMFYIGDYDLKASLSNDNTTPRKTDATWKEIFAQLWIFYDDSMWLKLDDVREVRFSWTVCHWTRYSGLQIYCCSFNFSSKPQNINVVISRCRFLTWPIKFVIFGLVIAVDVFDAEVPYYSSFSYMLNSSHYIIYIFLICFIFYSSYGPLLKLKFLQNATEVQHTTTVE